jgi:RNA polymerase sporulation-specific sigma factor
VDLVRQYRAGDEGAFTVLMRRHRGLIYTVTRQYYIQGASPSDAWQEGCIGFWKAVRDYDLEHNFPTFAALCVRRQVVSAVKMATAKKHALLNACEWIESAEEPPAPETADAGLWFEAMLALLTPMERLVLERRLDGHNDYVDLSLATGYSTKAVDNALQRSRRKLRQALAA